MFQPTPAARHSLTCSPYPSRVIFPVCTCCFACFICMCVLGRAVVGGLSPDASACHLDYLLHQSQVALYSLKPYTDKDFFLDNCADLLFLSVHFFWNFVWGHKSARFFEQIHQDVLTCRGNLGGAQAMGAKVPSSVSSCCLLCGLSDAKTVVLGGFTQKRKNLRRHWTCGASPTLVRRHHYDCALCSLPVRETWTLIIVSPRIIVQTRPQVLRLFLPTDRSIIKVMDTVSWVLGDSLGLQNSSAQT